MAITLSTGVTLEVAKTYGISIAVSAVTNATEAVATLAAGHGVVAGDYLEVSSGWDLLDKRVVRAKTVSTNDVTLEKVNTSNTAKFPAGSGIGSIRRITAWSQLSQLKSLSASGGDVNFADITSLSDLTQKQVPTTRSAVTMTLDVFDDPSLAWYADVTAADEARTPYGLKMNFPNGSKLVASAYWSLMRVPQVNLNEAMTTQITLSYAAEPVRYST